MALLTTEDVLNKTFTSVKFREGYDPVEVDEFLDEVVNTIYTLQVENTELKQKLEAAQRRVDDLPADGAVEAPVAEEPAVVETAEPEVAAEPTPEPVAPATPVREEPSRAPEDATAMLALAQRVHDEYVSNGREEGERIVAEAHAEGEHIIREAEGKRSEVLAQLEQERGMLESKIDELKHFESDYRSKLRDHLQRLLGEVSES